MRDKQMPFGLLFEEPVVDPGEMPVPIYDEGRDISFVERGGERVPLVSAAPSRMATVTLTEVAREPTDQDFDPAGPAWYLGTETETKAEGEATDRAPMYSLLTVMATETTTSVAKEDTD